MARLWFTLGLLALAPGLAAAAEPEGKSAKESPKTFAVPYRLTIPKHVLVRAKINGKGPFNFILDTGAPALIVATPVCKKLGVKADDNGWGTFDRFELEGGAALDKVKVRIETPFQLKGMNGMGLAGAEVHGLIGYDILCRFRITIDFSNDKLILSPLSYKPAPPLGLGTKGGGGAGGLETMGGVMEALGALMGRKPIPDMSLRGFLGLTLAEGGEFPTVTAVLENGPAGKAGIKVGDRVTKVQGRTVTGIDDVNRYASKATAGEEIKFTVQRDKDTREITLKMSEGI
jgi:hypothetical protein